MTTVSTMSDVAATIRENAVAQARGVAPVVPYGKDLAKLMQNPIFFDHLKYRLAVGVGACLGEHDRQVQAVYVYDPSANAGEDLGGESAPDTTLHMLGLVTAPSAALQAFVESLDRALVESLNDLPAPWFAEQDSILEVNLVTEEEAAHGLGWSALLHSLYAPPLKVWSRA